MSVSLWIPPILQFGQLAPGEAREGQTREAMAQAIKRCLFGGNEGGAPYERALAAFAGEIASGFKAPRDLLVARSLWDALFPDAGAVTDETGDHKRLQDGVEAAFCFGIHGLCSALARNRLDAPGLAVDDAGPAEDGDTDAETGMGADDWRVEYASVVAAIQTLLRQAAWRWLRDNDADETAKRDGVQVVAATLLDLLLGVLGDWFAVETGKTRTRNGRPHTEKSIVLRQPALARRLARLVAELPFRFTVQPLQEAVAYRPGDRGPADTDDAAYFRVDLIGYRRSNDFLRRFLAVATEPPYRAPEFLRYVEAVNIQQAVPWRINRAVLHWAQCLIAVGDGAAGPDCLAGLVPEALAEWREWVHRNFYRPQGKGVRQSIERPGEFLKSPLASRALEDLDQDGPDGAGVRFYLPWKADYRGRIYAETAWLTPQGGDLQRALLEFAQGRPLTAEGVRALRRHGANLVRRGRLLDDLGIVGRQVVTLAERERWVLEHEAEILASAAAPLAAPFWREVASKPMQFLAFCLAYRQWHLDPAAPVHLPVQIDGTCNGLQHIAALTGDAGLARAVNVLPTADGLPGDIYSELAVAAVDHLGCLARGIGRDLHADGLALADAWLAASLHRSDWLNRDTAKKVVMTIPYGASPQAQAAYVFEAIAADFERHWQEGPPALAQLDALVHWKEDKQPRRAFVAKVTKGQFGALRTAAYSTADEVARGLAESEWQRQRTLGAYVALAIVMHLRAALASRYPRANEFSNWLSDTAAAAKGLPLLWPSPLGFPVCQDKFKTAGTSATARIGAKTIRIDVQRLTEIVDDTDQRNALLPNLIHSLDATHLAMTLLAAREGGVSEIGSIHDCLLCHPNDAAVLGRAVRRTFAQLYRTGRLDLPDPLMRWRDWMALMLDLRAIRRRRDVLAAFDYPGEQAERDLQHDARRGDADATKALDVLASLYRRDPPERFLARLVLEYAVTLDDAKSAPAMPSPPCSKALPLTERAMSEYFFS